MSSSPAPATAFQVRSLVRYARSSSSRHIPSGNVLIANRYSFYVQFRSLLRQSRQFTAYNFREYARRRTIDAFREHRHETEERKIQEFMQDGIQNLRMMKVGFYLAVRLFALAPVLPFSLPFLRKLLVHRLPLPLALFLRLI